MYLQAEIYYMVLWLLWTPETIPPSAKNAWSIQLKHTLWGQDPSASTDSAPRGDGMKRRKYCGMKDQWWGKGASNKSSHGVEWDFWLLWRRNEWLRLLTCRKSCNVKLIHANSESKGIAAGGSWTGRSSNQEEAMNSVSHNLNLKGGNVWGRLSL